MKDLEEIEKEEQAIKMMVDMLAEITGDPRIIMVKKEHEFHNKMLEIAMNTELNNKQFEHIINLLEQFIKLVNDILKEDN